MKVEFVLETGFAGSVHREVVELPDDLTESEIDEEFHTWKGNLIEGSWGILDEGNS